MLKSVRDLLIKRQQNQIESLRHELKDLNDKLTSALEKKKVYRDRVSTEGSPSSNEGKRFSSGTHESTSGEISKGVGVGYDADQELSERDSIFEG
jgi:hypothetical protein